MTTADTLFALARAAIPDPRNPRPGDTYQRPHWTSGPRVIVVQSVVRSEVFAYVDGVRMCYLRFDLLMRSMPDARPVASETCPVDLPA